MLFIVSGFGLWRSDHGPVVVVVLLLLLVQQKWLEPFVKQVCLDALSVNGRVCVCVCVCASMSVCYVFYCNSQIFVARIDTTHVQIT